MRYRVKVTIDIFGKDETEAIGRIRSSLFPTVGDSHQIYAMRKSDAAEIVEVNITERKSER